MYQIIGTYHLKKRAKFRNLYIVKTFQFQLFNKRVTGIDYFRSFS